MAQRFLLDFDCFAVLSSQPMAQKDRKGCSQEAGNHISLLVRNVQVSFIFPKVLFTFEKVNPDTFERIFYGAKKILDAKKYDG